MYKRKRGKKLLAFTLAMCMMAGSTTCDVKAAEDVNVSIEDGKISIGNDYINREYSVNEDGSILTSLVENKWIGTTLEPQEGSEDFAMNVASVSRIEESDDAIVNDGFTSSRNYLDTSDWEATLKNYVIQPFADTETAKLFDNDLNTHVDNYRISGHPFMLDIDLGAEQTISGMYVNKRPGASKSTDGVNGTMGAYEIWTSADGYNYTQYTTGAFTQEDYNLQQVDGLYNVGERVYAEFESDLQARYIRVVQTGVALGTAQEFTSAEVGFYYGEKTNTLSQADWNAVLKRFVSSADFNDSEVAKLFDGNLSTHVDQYSISGHDFILDIDFGETQTFSGMAVEKRPGYTDSRYGINGTMGAYEVLASEDGEYYVSVKQGEFTADDYQLYTENGVHNIGRTVYADFGRDVEARYVRVIQKSVALGTSYEFSSAEIDFYQETQQPQVPTQVLDRLNWDVTITNNSGQVFNETHTNYLIDGNLNTNPDEYQKPGHPFYVDIDLGEEKTVRSISINKRPGFSDSKYGTNGTMGKFELYVSDDGVTWEAAGCGEFTAEAYNLHKEGNLYNVGDRVYANFYKPYTTRYVRVVQLNTSMGSADEFTSAELYLYEDQYYGPNWNTEPVIREEKELRSSDLTFKEAVASDIENGKKLTISYEPYMLNGVEVSINQVVVLENYTPYMRAFLEIQVPEDERENLTIDYIDTDRFVLQSDVEDVWTHPDTSKLSSAMIGKYELVLGQPIYANGFYMGSEFPSTDTQVVDGVTQIRYYSGKSIARMEADDQLTTDGKFVSWQNVIGAATGTDTATVQTDFFAYIEEIATPTEFRKQYNSWYDNMMNITDESIEASFLGVEEKLSANGIKPLDSYVVDDGWNNYYSVIGNTTYVKAGSTAGSGTPNRTGFWEFNNKFPNELYTSSALAEKLNSTFGLWVGPRGGYNHYSGFANYLEAKGTGYYTANTNDVCVASKRYTDNLKALFVDYEKRFGIDYWKWDGFANKPCTDASHDHMTGGYNNMYYTSDLWERWIDVFEVSRAAREEDGKGLFINATCYVNLSPWLLQWVNTVWIQTSADTGELGTGDRHEQKIYFRDNSYYKLYVQNELQFPLNHLYNHDPIYGVSDNSSATTDVFREYLLANAMRGTAFWELYYSPSIMDDAKWKVAADVLVWAEENHDVLKNAKIFGSSPDAGVYGYSCWTEDEGIISFVNPLSSATTYTLTMDEAVGVKSGVQNLTGIQVEPYAEGVLDDTLSYGDTLEVTLQPHETLIYHFGMKDAQAPEVVSAKTSGKNEITVKFSERIQSGSFTVNGEAAEAELKEDYRTVVLTVEEELLSENTVEINGVKDFGGNELQETITVTYYENDVIAWVSSPSELQDAKDVTIGVDTVEGVSWLKNLGKEYTVDTANVLEGSTDFTVFLNVKTTDAGVNLFNSNDEVILSVDADGFVNFQVGALIVSSKEEVTTVVEKAHGTFGTEEYVPTSTETTLRGNVNDGNVHSIMAVREVNGLLKIYIDGTLSASAYDAANVNEALEGGEMTVGAEGFTGKLADLQVLNRAYGYSEAPEKIESSGKDIFVNTSGWTASACSEMDGTANTGGDKDASAAFDGDDDTRWHTNYNGQDTCEPGTHWIQIDFNKEESFDKVHYTTRGASYNGSIKEYKLELLDADGQVIETFTGEFAELSKKPAIVLGDAYQAYGIRLTAVSTQNGKDFAAADEIGISLTETLVSGDELQAEIERLLAKTEEINLEDYTAETADALKAVVEKILSIDRTSVENLQALEDELDAAIAALQLEESEADPNEVCNIFTDVEHGAWYEGSVQYVYDEGIIIGDGNIFAPDNNATRAMIAVILYRLAGSPEVTDYTKYDKFSDLPAEHLWYSDAVAWALNEGVSTGDDVNMLYNPDASVTREQLTLFLWRYAKYTGEDVTVNATEEELFGGTYVDEWAKEGFAWAVDNGIIKGAEATDDAGNIYYDLNPQGTATRAQLARVLHRYLGGATE